MENKKCENCAKDEALEKILMVYKQDKDNLIQILNEVQEHYGYIPTAAGMRVSEYLLKIYAKTKRKIQHSCMPRNSLLCKRFRKTIRQNKRKTKNRCRRNNKRSENSQ